MAMIMISNKPPPPDAMSNTAFACNQLGAVLMTSEYSVSVYCPFSVSARYLNLVKDKNSI